MPSSPCSSVQVPVLLLEAVQPLLAPCLPGPPPQGLPKRWFRMPGQPLMLFHKHIQGAEHSQSLWPFLPSHLEPSLMRGIMVLPGLWPQPCPIVWMEEAGILFIETLVFVLQIYFCCFETESCCVSQVGLFL
jgi:hypothetical protein